MSVQPDQAACKDKLSQTLQVEGIEVVALSTGDWPIEVSLTEVTHGKSLSSHSMCFVQQDL